MVDPRTPREMYFWKWNFDEFRRFFTVRPVARNLNFANIQTFHHEFIIGARKLWRYFFMNLKTKFWRISKIFYSQTSCSKAEFLQILKNFNMNLSLEQESSYGIFCESEKQILTNFKAFLQLPWWLTYFPRPPVLLPVQQIFLLKRILLHQGTCPTNHSHSTGGAN